MLSLVIVTTLAVQSIAWSPSVQVARSYAVKSGKPIMLVFGQVMGGTQLDYCLSGASVIRLSEKFVCFRAAETAAPLFAKIDKKKVQMPIIFVEADGTFIGRMGGFFWPKELAENMRFALWAREAGKTKYAGVSKLKMCSLEAFRTNVAAAARTLNALPVKPSDSGLLEAYLMLADQYRADRLFKESVGPLQKALLLPLDSWQEFRVRTRLASSYLRLDRLDEAKIEAARSLALAGEDREDRRIPEFQLDRIEIRRKVLATSKA